MFKQRPGNHLRGQSCPKCYKSSLPNVKKFVEKANKIHNNKYNYSLANYVNAHAKIKILCSKHGTFEQSPNSHLAGSGCLKCNIEKQTLGKETFITKAKKTHDNKYDYSLVEYVNSHAKIKIKCSKHGVFEQTPTKHLSRQGCPSCGNSKKLTKEEFIEKANNIHNNKYKYNKVDYTNAVTKIVISCYKHGSFKQTPNAHLCGHGCPKCSGSNTENEVLDLASKVFRLKFLKVRLPEMRGLELDVYNFSKKLAFEYQGEGHYLRFVNEKSHFLTEERILAVKKRDKKKKKLCKSLIGGIRHHVLFHRLEET